MRWSPSIGLLCIVLIPGLVLGLPLLPSSVLRPVLAVLLVVLSVVALLGRVWRGGGEAGLSLASYHLTGHVLNQVLRDLHLGLTVLRLLHCQGHLIIITVSEDLLQSYPSP